MDPCVRLVRSFNELDVLKTMYRLFDNTNSIYLGNCPESRRNPCDGRVGVEPNVVVYYLVQNMLRYSSFTNLWTVSYFVSSYQNMHILDNIFTSINTRHSLLTKQELGAQILDPARGLQSTNSLISSFINLLVLATPLFEQINICKQFHSSTVM